MVLPLTRSYPYAILTRSYPSRCPSVRSPSSPPLHGRLRMAARQHAHSALAHTSQRPSSQRLTWKRHMEPPLQGPSCSPRASLCPGEEAGPRRSAAEEREPALARWRLPNAADSTPPPLSTQATRLPSLPSLQSTCGPADRGCHHSAPPRSPQRWPPPLYTMATPAIYCRWRRAYYGAILTMAARAAPPAQPRAAA